MNIDLARTFLEVVASGNMSAAAERLHVTHSTVTVRIKNLEDILQRQLLNRSRGGVTLTADGARFLEFAQSLVRTWQTARRHVSLATNFESVLSIGVDSTLWGGVMGDWLVTSRRDRPQIAMRCEVGSSQNLLQKLFQGWLDVCLVYETRSRIGFRTEKLFDDPLILASTVRREAQKEMDPKFVAVDYDESVRYQEVDIWGESEATPHLSVNSLDMGIECVARYGGTILLPKRLLSHLPFELYPIPAQPMVERTAYMVYSIEAFKRRYRRFSAAQLKASLQAHFSQEYDLGMVIS
ncbi:MAG: LysR family transcriptional regulator [Mesorhizobium sp.]|nr:MAG: LysR family transcriptional regulator [Mesorhizobium sp.]